MKDITSLLEFLEVLQKISDYTVDTGLKNMLTENNYIMTHEDFSHLITKEDYMRYLPLIADAIEAREEVLDIDISRGEIDVTYGLSYCPFYQESLGDKKNLDCGKWHVELLDKNDPYGNIRYVDGIMLNRPLWESEKPGVAFYDTSQDPERFPIGQFTYTYYMDTLRGTDGFGRRAENGLCLDMDIPAWTVEKNDMQNILSWLDAVAEKRNLDGLCKDNEELSLWLDNGSYFYIQTCEDGWDYTLYNEEFLEIDGGQLDNPEYSMAEATREILRDFGFSVKNPVPISSEELQERVSQAEEKQFEALSRKIRQAEDKSSQQRSEKSGVSLDKDSYEHL